LLPLKLALIAVGVPVRTTHRVVLFCTDFRTVTGSAGSMVPNHQVPVASLTLLLLKFTQVAVGVPIRTAHRVVVIMTVFRTATCGTIVLWDTVDVVFIFKDLPGRTRTSFHTF
jgi:hypothetical protein